MARERLTWCATKDCAEVVDLDTSPHQDQNKEVHCAPHGRAQGLRRDDGDAMAWLYGDS